MARRREGNGGGERPLVRKIGDRHSQRTFFLGPSSPLPAEELMSSFTQLNPPLPVYATGKGNGLAHGVIDYGPEHDLIWVTAIDETREIWCVPNPQIRMRQNWTMGRTAPAPPASKNQTTNLSPCSCSATTSIE